MRRRLYKTESAGTTKAPYAYYPFNGNIQDASGNGRHLTIPATSPQFVAGYNGKKALSCGNYFANWGLDTPFKINSDWQDFCIIFRANFLSSQPTYPNVFDKDHAGSNRGFNFQKVSGVWEWGFHNQTTTPARATISSGWHTVACVRRKNDGFVGLFVDGALINFVTYTNSLVLDEAALKIAVCYGWAASRYFNGLLQDFLIYKEALTNQEVISIMNGI